MERASAERAIPRLAAPRASFYLELVKLPIGVAVLHLRNPARPSTWQLVALNSPPARLIGQKVEDYLALRVESTPGSKGKFDASAVYRDVLLHGHVRRLGTINEPIRRQAGNTYSLQAFPLPDNCVGIMFENVTEIFRARRAQIVAELRLNQICDSARAILWTANPGTLEFTHVTEEARSILGYWIERWYKEPNFWRNHAHPDDWPLIQSTCSEITSTANDQRFDCRMYDIEGRIHWFRIHSRLGAGPAGRANLSGVMVDITDQKRNEHDARELSVQVMRAQEQERKRISRELHDSIGQYLTGLQWSLSSLSRNGHGTKGLGEKLDECVSMVKACMEELRSVSYALRPPALDMLGLLPALRWQTKSFADQSGLQIKLEVTTDIRRLSADVELALFRFLQECLSNVRKHARTDSACVRLIQDSSGVALEVEDRGVGVPPNLFEFLESGGRGIGLLKMRERIHEVGGTLEVESQGRGTLVRARVPRSERHGVAVLAPRTEASVQR